MKALTAVIINTSVVIGIISLIILALFFYAMCKLNGQLSRAEEKRDKERLENKG